jgi:hypothetical protein
MYPGMLHWWRNARRAGACGPQAGRGPSGEGFSFHPGGDDLGGGGSFGVRRPLRFLAYRLNLNETQVEELAKILDELKTERAQAAVDDRRVTSGFADALGLDQFDAVKAADAGTLRLKSAERLRDAVLKALARMHTVLDSQQRAQLAYLIRTGTLSI